jgi:hypothetical protein
MTGAVMVLGSYTTTVTSGAIQSYS